MSETGGYSVVDELVNGNPVELTGEGELAAQPDQEIPPVGPGRVRFALHYDPQERHFRHTHAIKLGLEAIDEGGGNILRWQPAWQGRVPFPRYELVGTVEVGRERLPIRMDNLDVNYRAGTGHFPFIKPHNSWQVLVGKGIDAEVVRAQAVIANLPASPVDTLTGGLQVRLEPFPRVGHSLKDPDLAGRFLPTCLLHLERLEGADGPDVTEAIEVFGWLLSFYTGWAIHPIAWEGETEDGPSWCLRADDLDPLPAPTFQSCLQREGIDSLEPFLVRAWHSWLSLGDVQQRRLRGVVNTYRAMLATTFPTQKVALIAMFLERFRDLVLDSRTVLEKINAEEKKLNPNKAAKLVKGVLKDYASSISELTDEDRNEIRQAIGRIGSGKMNDLLRPSFSNTLTELYSRAALPIDQDVLSAFIAERDRVIHGHWDATRAGTIEAFWWAEYSLNLLERLILRFFGYEGPYWDRVKERVEHFEHREPNW